MAGVPINPLNSIFIRQSDMHVILTSTIRDGELRATVVTLRTETEAYYTIADHLNDCIHQLKSTASGTAIYKNILHEETPIARF